DGEHATGAPHPRLHLVVHEEDPVSARQLPQALQELVRGDQVSTLALNRLDDDGGDFVGGDQVQKELVFDELETFRPTRFGGQTEPTAVAVGKGSVKDAGHERSEPSTLGRLAGGQRERAHGPTVKGAEKRDNVRALGDI